MLDAVDDDSIGITENNITVLAHQLNNQCFGAQIAHLIEMLNLKVDDTLHMRLVNTCNTSVCDMLAQHHTEIRCGHGAWLVCPGQVYKR